MGLLQRLYEANDADYRQQILALMPQAGTLLDVGCDDGAWTEQIARAARASSVAGIELSDARVAAQGRGIDAHAGDLEKDWPFDDNSFDVVHANQVIEHLKRLDHFVSEIARVLRPGGRVVVCTENLASWHNVAALVLGYTPFSLTNVSRLRPIGNPWALHLGEEPGGGESWQHAHVLTLTGLLDLFEAHGFAIERRFAAGYYPAAGPLGRWLARRDPRHAHFIGIVARTS